MPGVVLERKPVYPVSAGTAPEYMKLAVVDGGGWGGIFIKAHLLARDVVNESGHPLPAASGAHGVKRTISAMPVMNEIKFISVDGGTWRGLGDSGAGDKALEGENGTPFAILGAPLCAVDAAGV